MQSTDLRDAEGQVPNQESGDIKEESRNSSSAISLQASTVCKAALHGTRNNVDGSMQTC